MGEAKINLKDVELEDVVEQSFDYSVERKGSEACTGPQPNCDSPSGE